MFLLWYEDLVWNHVEDETLEELKKSSKVRRAIFSNLTVGVNVNDVKSYQDIAVWLLTVPEDKLKRITLEDVVNGVGSYIDETGYLV